MMNIFLSVLVPLLIGVATVLIAVIQLQIANKQRAHDLQISNERREQDLRAAATLQQDLVLAAYIEQMSDLMLRSGFTINDTTVANICRAKTLTAIRQLDPKRKTYLIRFLYEARMIRHNQPHIDLSDAVLDNIDLSAKYTPMEWAAFEASRTTEAYRTSLSEVFFKRVSLNHATFTNLYINHSSFQEASLIGANFTGSLFSSVSFVRAILQNSSFRDAKNTIAIDFKSADLFGSDISDKLLLDAISIEDAILPNGTRGVQPNLVAYGDAESPDCETNASIPSAWHVEQISSNVTLSVASYLAAPSVTYPANVQIHSGRCFYVVRGREGQVMMRQTIRAPTRYIAYSKNISLTFLLVCAPVATVGRGQASIQLYIEQIDNKGMSLANYTRKYTALTSSVRVVQWHPQVDRFIITLVFNRFSAPLNANNTDSDIFIYCDNIYFTAVPDRREE
ncbi:unnamed protein product [Adineta steineri]|uniref:Pentapeptide repeat-containing protein n=1 Tax=Adineta steineri TaxID=433720 RepID=A0A815YCL4_9BILA|nr:unnamed protein product [Adineta steineri]CAF1568507.1 unnamed protein product [Adineta steineri]